MNTDANADGNYEMAADGKIEIEYQVKVKDSIVYIGKWERDIELFNYNAEIDSNRSSIKFLNIYGTDLQKYCLIERVSFGINILSDKSSVFNSKTPPRLIFRGNFAAFEK